MNKIIDILPGEKENGDKHFSLINGNWRCAEYEARKAEDDTKRMEAKRKGEETL